MKFFGNIFADSKQVTIQARLRSVTTNLEIIDILAADVVASYWRQGDLSRQITVLDLPSLDSIWIKGGWIQVSNTLNKGLYRFDVPDESVASGADWVIFTITVAGCYVFEERYNLETKIEANVSDGILDSGVNDTYISVNGADTYFATKLNSVIWTDSDNTLKLKALQQATKIIDRLRFIGTKVLDTQNLEFPRIINDLITEIDIPDDIKIANAEIAYSLLDGIDPDEELKNLFKISNTFAQTKTVYHPQIVPEWLRAGVPSSLAWAYLKPYLIDPRAITLSRVS